MARGRGGGARSAGQRCVRRRRLSSVRAAAADLRGGGPEAQVGAEIRQAAQSDLVSFYHGRGAVALVCRCVNYCDWMRCYSQLSCDPVSPETR